MHDDSLHRLQIINAKRLHSNLVSSFKAFMSQQQAQDAATLAAAMIDGLWLRAVLGKADQAQFKQAELQAKHYITSLISTGSV
jgi:TetR/AcrR family transcriptional repressor of bet genes